MNPVYGVGHVVAWALAHVSEGVEGGEGSRGLKPTLQTGEGVGEAGFELFQLEVEFDLAVELGFPVGAGVETGDLACQAIMFDQSGPSSLNRSAVCNGHEATGQLGGGVRFELLDPALVECLKIPARLMRDGE